MQPGLIALTAHIHMTFELCVNGMNFDDLFSSNFPNDSAIAEKVARNVTTRAAEDWKEAVVLSLYDDIFKLKKRLSENPAIPANGDSDFSR